MSKMPTEEILEYIHHVRKAIEESYPHSRERRIALTKLDEAASCLEVIPVEKGEGTAEHASAAKDEVSRIFEKPESEEKGYVPYPRAYNPAIIIGHGCQPYVVHLGIYLDHILSVPGFSYTNYVIDHIGDYINNGEVALQVVARPGQFDYIRKFLENQLHGACRILWLDDYIKELGCTFEGMVDFFRS